MRVLWYGNATYRQPNHYVPIICGRNISATCKKRSNGAVDKKQTKIPFSSVKLKVKSTESQCYKLLIMLSAPKQRRNLSRHCLTNLSSNFIFPRVRMMLHVE